MKLFGGNTKKSGSEETFVRTAKIMYMAAGAETATDAFPDLDLQIIDRLNTLLFYTRAAIFTGWLTRLSQIDAGTKWSKLLVTFEPLIVPEGQPRLPILRLLKQIDELIDRGQGLTGKDQPPLREFPAITKIWWNDWLGLLLSSDQIEIIGPARALHLSLQVIDETQFLGTLLSDIAKDL